MNKNYANINNNVAGKNKKFDEKLISPYQVVGVLSMDEPMLELNFPVEEDEKNGICCAGPGTEIAVFYTPGLCLATKQEFQQQQDERKRLIQVQKEKQQQPAKRQEQTQYQRQKYHKQ